MTRQKDEQVLPSNDLDTLCVTSDSYNSSSVTSAVPASPSSALDVTFAFVTLGSSPQAVDAFAVSIKKMVGNQV